MKEPLMKPLDDAGEWLEGGSFLQSTWGDLQKFYLENIKDFAPFAPWSEDRESVSADVLQSFMGLESGRITKVREAVGEDTLPPAVERWMVKAEALAELFFKAKSDDLKPLSLRMEFAEPVLEPKKFGKSHRV